MDELVDELTGARAAGLFSGADLAIRHPRGRLDIRIGPWSLFDLASLTKPLATATLTAQLVAAGELTLERRVQELLPEFQGEGKEEVRVADLLAHRAGLPAWRRWYESQAPNAPDADALLAAVLREPLEVPPGERTRYSDTGYILMAAIVGIVSGEPDLGHLFTERVAVPAGVADRIFYGPVTAERRTAAAPTGDDPWRGRPLQGEVHDRHAWILGGRAGHAGLFGDAGGVIALTAPWLEPDAPPTGLDAETVRRWRAVPEGPSPGGRPLAWDRIGPGSSQAGTGISGDAFGHLGFTGTSVWADPHRETVVALLTNRVATDPEGQAYRRWRPAFHDRIWRALDAGRLDLEETSHVA